MFRKHSDSVTSGTPIPSPAVSCRVLLAGSVSAFRAPATGSAALCILVLAFCGGALRVAAASGDWRTYEVYQPRVTRHDVIDARSHPHKYNHCATIAWFQDRWLCMWGSNTHPDEHAPGQRIYSSTSPDGRTWSPIEMLFSNEARCENPVRYPVGKGHQWQPNVGIVDGELWAIWNQGGSAHDFDGSPAKAADLRGLYFSRLKSADGKWINRRLEWDGVAWPTVGGRSFYIASTQDLYRLRSGRVLAPVTLYAGKGRASDAPPQTEGWWGREKRNSVIYTDDGGGTWHLSPGCITPGFSWIQWEPTVWEQPDGSVMMFARNNTHWGLGHGKPTSGQYLLWSVSKNGGETWAPHQFVPMESVCSRMHVAPLDGRGVWGATHAGDDFTGRRYVMVHNDAPGALYEWAKARRNLALFFTRGGGIDFVAGNSLTGDEPEVAYPQMWRHGDTLAICYTQGNSAPRSIRVALVDPLPQPDRHYIFPRSNDLVAGARPRRVCDTWSFNREQHIATRAPVEPGDDGFSFGAWIQPRASGTLFDTRPDSAVGGFVIMLRSRPASASAGKRGSVIPVLTLMGPKEEIAADLPLTLDGRWQYLGVTVNNRTGEALFCVDGEHGSVRFETVRSHPLKGATAHIGGKRLANSKLAGFAGDVRFVAVYAGGQLDSEGHAWLHNQFAKGLGCPELPSAQAPKDRPMVWMDAADRDAFERDFDLPSEGHRGGTEVVTAEGLRALRVRDQGSAGIDLDENDRPRGDKVTIRFRFRVEGGDSQTLFTVGDFNQPARLIAHSGQILLRAGEAEMPCGAIGADGWTPVWLETWGDRTIARIGDGPPVEVSHHPEATWAYIGEGFPNYGQYPGTRFLLDIASLQTRVGRATP